MIAIRAFKSKLTKTKSYTKFKILSDGLPEKERLHFTESPVNFEIMEE